MDERRLRARLLGAFVVQLGDGREAGPWIRPSARRFVQLLLLREAHRAGRDELAALLFPDLAPARAANAVSKALTMARVALERGGARILDADRNAIWVRPDVQVSTDLAAHLGRLRAALESSISRSEPLLREALSDRGALLESEPQTEWADEARRELESLRGAARLELARVLERLAGAQHLEDVARAWADVFERDPTNEESCAGLMRAVAALGERERALRAYRRCAAALRSELDVEPSTALAELHARVLEGPPAMPPARAAEVKLISVLVIDGAGVAAVAEQVDRLRTQFGAMPRGAGASRHVLFGLPRTHDDDAERAVRMALALQGALGRRPRFAVATGEVLVADAEGPAGDVLTRASQLLRDARAGDVVVDQTTAELSRDAVGYTLRGPKTRVVRGMRDSGWRAAAASGPLLGRERELRILLDTFRRVRDDARAQLATIVGPAGVGKSRLVAELLSELARSEEPLVLRGRCLPYGQGAAYWPLIEMLHADLGIGPLDDRQSAAQKLAARVEELLPAGLRAPVEHRLAILLGLDVPAARMPDVTLTQVPREIGWGMWRYLEALAGRRPVVAVVDDLQYAGAELRELIARIAERVTEVPLLFVCVARSEFLEEHPDWGARQPHATTLNLQPLRRADARALVRHLVGSGLTDRARESIVESAAGIPFFCEELARSALEGPAVADIAARDGPARRIPALPPAIRAILEARLDALPPGEKRLAQAASVIGERFRRSELARVIAVATLDLQPLVSKAIFAEDEDQGEVLRFRHPLLREVAYRSLPHAVLAELHERVVDALEDPATTSTLVPDAVAFQAARAYELAVETGLPRREVVRRAKRALEWNLRLGESAFTRHDPVGIATALTAARDALGSIGSAADERARSRVLLLEAAELAFAGSFARAERPLREAAARAERAGEFGLAGAALLTSARTAWYRGQIEAAEGAARDAERLLERAGDASGALEARFLGLVPALRDGRHSAVLAEGERLYQRAIEIGDRARAAILLMNLITQAASAGRPLEAETYADEAERLASDLGLRTLVAEVRRARGYLLALRGEAGALEVSARELIATADEAGDVYLALVGERYLAQGLIEQGRVEEADVVLESAIERSERSGDRWNRSELIAFRAAVALARGECDEALGLATEARRLVVAGDTFAEVTADVQLARVHAARADGASADMLFASALATIRRTERGAVAADVAIAYAAFLADQGRSAEARALLGPAQEWLEARGYHFRRELIAKLAQRLSGSGPDGKSSGIIAS